MSNGSAVETRHTASGWEGLYRPVWSTDFRIVKNNKAPALFETSNAAELAAWRVLYQVEQRVMRRDGDRITAAKSAGDALFKISKKRKNRRRKQ